MGLFYLGEVLLRESPSFFFSKSLFPPAPTPPLILGSMVRDAGPDPAVPRARGSAMSPPLQPEPLAHSTPLALMARSRLSRRREVTSRPLASPSQVCLVPEVVSPQPGPAPLHWPQLLCPWAALAGLAPLFSGHACSAFRSPPSCHGPFPGLPLPTWWVLRSTVHASTRAIFL